MSTSNPGNVDTASRTVSRIKRKYTALGEDILAIKNKGASAINSEGDQTIFLGMCEVLNSRFEAFMELFDEAIEYSESYSLDPSFPSAADKLYLATVKSLYYEALGYKEILQRKHNSSRLQLPRQLVKSAHNDFNLLVQMENPSGAWEADWAEYVSFVLTMTISAAVGVYFGFIKGGQNTISGYLLGSKEISLIPMSISLITAYFSAITILGVPAEVYTYGVTFSSAVLSLISIGFVSSYIVIPVFHKLQLVSAYEYIELRFGRGMRMAMSLIFVIHQLSYMPMTIYAPAMAINQATKINENLVSSVMSGVCIFYTTLGGLKAVVWTDTFQAVVIFFSLFAVLIMGTIRVGGVQSVIAIASEGGRLDLDFVPDLTGRMNFWTAQIAVSLMWMANCSFSPESIQRFTALPTLRQAKISAFLLPLGIIVAVITCSAIALVVYAEFHDCDPVSSGMIIRTDQLLSLFVLKVLGDIRGLGGLFYAGLVAGSLSTMSAGFNSLAGIIYRDFVSSHFQVAPSERNATLIMKGIVCVIGFICVLLAIFINKLGDNLVEIAVTFGGLTVGPIIGIFLLGLLVPWVTNKGVMCGSLVGIFVTAWFTVAGRIYAAEIASTHPVKTVRVDGCYHNFTVNDIFPRNSVSNVPTLYRLSSFLLPPLGIFIVMTISVIVSYLTGFNRLLDVNPDLISPLVHRFLPKKPKTYEPVPLEVIELPNE
ncbi:hypothetical protein GE061_003593 [Apolygus lucorum]|uniref:Sodium-coupled monocarboxylate transporter 1 n=1 Tax=Apolygus lucorum TaxID=248454 RepID=A0A8S9X522_APOLU|nr:hypothetical protein GE061_003593 [Apolygus lucorum]